VPVAPGGTVRHGRCCLLVDEDAPAVLRFYLDWIADCLDEFMTSPCSAGHPRCPASPPNLVGELAIAVPACHARPVDACQPGMR
ncbi:MAG TPA: hypothetical protein VK365_05505, partial [Nocardioidaceae bacterium]|nr:hypothetical protein [Nocardioidaceae bacterium]